MIRSTIKRSLLPVLALLMILLISCNPAKKYEKEEANSIADYPVRKFKQEF